MVRVAQDTFLGRSCYGIEEDEVKFMVVKTDCGLDENRGRYGLSKSDMTHRRRENLWGLDATHQAWMMGSQLVDMTHKQWRE